jgi:hypothetical protein
LNNLLGNRAASRAASRAAKSFGLSPKPRSNNGVVVGTAAVAALVDDVVAAMIDNAVLADVKSWAPTFRLDDDNKDNGSLSAAAGPVLGVIIGSKPETKAPLLPSLRSNSKTKPTSNNAIGDDSGIRTTDRPCCFIVGHVWSAVVFCEVSKLSVQTRKSS